MEGDQVDDADILRAAATSGARVLLIGRRALVVLGAPVMTSDYDFWVHIDDIEKFNAAFASLGHVSNKTPDEARRTGRYVLENGHHVDVMVARGQGGDEDTKLDFIDAWRDRQQLEVPGGVLCLPSIEHLIRTKRWAGRAKDITDIQFLEALRRGAL